MQSLLGQPSAINRLLGLLAEQPPAGQPGQPVPMPAAPMPNVNMTPTPVGQINAGMSTPDGPQSLLGHVHDFLVDRMGGNLPAEYQQGGLLSSQEMQSAKPGLMQIIAHSDSYRKNLDRILQMKQFASEVGEKLRLKGVRADMAKMFAAPANEDNAGTLSRMQKMMAYSVANGDFETADRLKGIVAEMAIPSKATDNAPHTLPTSQGIMQWDPATKKYVPTGFQPAEKAPRNIDPLSPAGIAAQVKLAEEKPAKDNPQQQLTAARASAGIAEMNNANSGLSAYEDKLVNGTASIKGLEQFIGSVGDSFLLEDMKSKAAQSLALTRLNTQNPDLARYIRRGLSFAEGETGISQRPSDYRTKLAAFLSTASAGASPEMIADIRSRRESILGAVNASKLAMKSPSGGGKPKPTQAQYNSARARFSDAQLAEHYDLSGLKRK